MACDSAFHNGSHASRENICTWATMRKMRFASALQQVHVRKAMTGQRLCSYWSACLTNTGRQMWCTSTQWTDLIHWVQCIAMKWDISCEVLLSNTYNWPSKVISVLEKSKQWSLALSVLSIMTEKKVTPDTVTYNAAISRATKIWATRSLSNCFKKWFWNVLNTWDTFSHFDLGPNNSPESNSNENQTESLSPNGPSQVLPQHKTEALVVHTGVTLWCCFNIAKASDISTF